MAPTQSGYSQDIEKGLMNIIFNLEALQKQGDALLLSKLAVIKDSAKTIVLFGAGSAGQLSKDILNAHGIYPAYFTDNTPERWHTQVDGTRVIPPASLPEINNVFVIICCWDLSGITLQLQQMHVTEYDGTLYTAFLAMQNRECYRRNIDKILSLADQLVDERSRQVLWGLIKHAFSLDYKILKHICDQDQYFFDPRFFIRLGDTVVDGGAFIGDTVADIILRFGRNFQTIHCFEPNVENYNRLVKYVLEQGLEDRVIPYSFGLSDKRASLCFEGSGAGFHMGTELGEHTEGVNLISLDELFQVQRIDFVKLDVEGAELLALRGGAEVIKRDHPRLAICSYHFPEHIWEIPFLIASMVPEYNIIMRHHALSLQETVVYAVVK